jgi:hypothetical protein
MEAINSGIVMKGPIPTMLEMFRAVAGSKPKARVRRGCISVFIAMGARYVRVPGCNCANLPMVCPLVNEIVGF